MSTEDGLGAAVRPSTVRIARRTVRLQECSLFYTEVVGLPLLTSFRDHDGYDGDVLGIPDESVQLELVRTPNGGPVPGSRCLRGPRSRGSGRPGGPGMTDRSVRAVARLASSTVTEAIRVRSLQRR
ncbi:MAG: hypothetical protein JWP74_3265 [Marmoricola sp.]|nr:hypothetical protein [Marmoricola sp.]